MNIENAELILTLCSPQHKQCRIEMSPSVLKRCVPKALAFAFGLRLRSKARCFKTRVLGRRLPNGKPQERLRFRALRSETLAFKKRIAIMFCDLKTSLSARGPGLAFRAFAFKKRGVLRLRSELRLKPTKGGGVGVYKIWPRKESFREMFLEWVFQWLR